MKKLLVVCLLFAASAQGNVVLPELIGGRPALKGEFPEIVYIRSGNARCSATIVGPQVILTAAHCVKDQGQIDPVDYPVDFVVDQIIYTAKCRQAPLYRDQLEDHDMALCKIDKKLSIKPAKIDKGGPKLGSQILLTGYGCTEPGGTGGGNDGILRIGKAKVYKMPQGKNHWFYTQDASALCFGDSGGPAMLSEKRTGKHSIVGVNSRGNIEDTSLLTATFTKASIAFFESFAEEEGVEICGISESSAVH